jgi:hypothetical protein
MRPNWSRCVRKPFPKGAIFHVMLPRQLSLRMEKRFSCWMNFPEISHLYFRSNSSRDSDFCENLTLDMNTYVHCNMSPWLVFLLEAAMRSACGNSQQSKYIKGTCKYLAVFEIATMIYCETFVKMHRIFVMRFVWNVERHNFFDSIWYIPTNALFIQ